MTITKQKLEQWREQHRTGPKYSTHTPEFRQAVQRQAAELDKPWAAEYFLVRPIKVVATTTEELPPEVVSLFEKQRDINSRPGVFEELYNCYGVDFHNDPAFKRVEFAWRSTLRGSFQIVRMRLSESGRLQDHRENGEEVLRLDRNPKPLPDAIAILLRIALAKGWIEIEGQGSDGFLLALWPQAESLDIVIRPRPEQQAAWAQYQVEKQKQKLKDYTEHDALYPEEQATMEKQILCDQVKTQTQLPPKKMKL